MNMLIHLFNKNRSKLFYYYFLIPLLPVFLFGLPPLYGDDYNSIDSITSMSFFSSVEAWADSYGIFYRPIGAFIHYGLHYLFYPNLNLLYFVSLFIYLLISFLLFQLIQSIKELNFSLSNFIAIFFISFPLNVTAYLQLSSLYYLVSCVMMLASLLIFNMTKIKYHIRLILTSLIWCIALFTYEQITGLILIFLILEFYNQKGQNFFKRFYYSVLKISPIILITIIFMTLYFTLEKNPKILVINDINIQKTEIINQNEELEEFYNQKKAKRSFYTRFEQLVSFYISNISYSINNILTSGFRGLILLMLTMILIFSSKFSLSNFNSNKILIIGLVWFVVTLMPFALFRGFHIPVYNLLLPIIGMAIIIYFVLNKVFKNHSLLYSLMIKSLILTFVINHYGVFFGLKEELSFWESIGSKLIPHKEELLNGEKILIEDVYKKYNNHIFWLERANGYRHLNDIVGIGNLKIIKNTNSKDLTFLKNRN